MAWVNQTMVTEFVLLGLSETWEVKVLLFVFFLLLYTATLFNNVLIFSAIISDHRLSDSPMLFLLGHLAFLDLCLSSFATPRYLFDFVAQHQAISFQGCMAQIFFLHLFAGGEMILLTAMAYDRYVAICHPLRYASLMSRHHCIGLVLASWAGGLLHASVQLGFTISAPFCGPNQVDNYFCDLPFVIQLACIDTYPLEVMMMTNSGIMSLVCLLVLLLSYALILSRIHSRSRSEGPSKAASTCTSHLIVVTMYLGPCLFMYLRPGTRSMIDKVLSVFYISITPFMNPTVYALRNNDMKAAIRRLGSKFMFRSYHAHEQLECPWVTFPFRGGDSRR
ncbi:olfactory receptor 4K3-like [Rhineura floridana]|uniref:olfactory receptor 4K3-like n=1 Tax=Rhineura floridana TaxID=261503 RepID=UPI002AC840FD|nr:olfactory receptor 4K3-like [Rhineura floridana]